MSEFNHITVMLHQAVEGLAINPEGIYIDGTFGRGGHSRLILSKLNNKGRLIVFDRDQQAINTALALAKDEPRLTVIHQPFSAMRSEIERLGLLGKIDGILLDLGVSSPQLDDAQRGFSFMQNGPLDMRMDQTSGQTAREYLYQVSEKELANVLFNYGEEKNSRLIARNIKQLAANTSFADFLPDTNSLVELIKRSSKKFDKNKNPATRSFQAIRIAVNGELDELKQVLDDSISLLATNGRLSIISFHSLEDRIVKQFFQQHTKGKPIPKNLPILDAQWETEIYFAPISKAIKPTDEEINLNPRSRSAILRWGQRTEYQHKSHG